MRFTFQRKRFDDLSEQEVLALAISSEEDDASIYRGYGERLRAEYPASAAIFDGMAARSDAEFTRDLQMLIGLATIFLGDSGSIVNGDFVRSPEMTPMKASAVAGDADRLAPMMSL